MNFQLLDVLKAELLDGFGCTEPGAVAYCASIAREALGCMPTHMDVHASGHVIKNVNSVAIPGVEEIKGLRAAAVLGAFGADPKQKLSCIIGLKPRQISMAKELLAQKGFCTAHLLDESDGFHCVVTMEADGHHSRAEIKDYHTHVIDVSRDGVGLLTEREPYIWSEGQTDPFADCGIHEIVQFARDCELARCERLLAHQIATNLAIAEEGLSGEWGVGVGKMLMKSGTLDTCTRCKAYAAAGSDARMSGCGMPVVINAGSGNQGLTVTLPIVIYGRDNCCEDEAIYRALLVSNLVSIYIKRRIGLLSAFCGAVSAAAGAGAGIAFLSGADMRVIDHTIINTLGNVSGIVCDGAKASCAAKIASSIDAAYMGYRLARGGHVYKPGEGLTKDDVESTIEAIVKLGRDGMKQTNRELLHIMLGQ